MAPIGYTPANARDLIVARATPPGAGAIAILRVDGEGTRDLVERFFRPTGKTKPTDAPRRATVGVWEDADGIIDEGLTLFFSAPNSYTGNDLAEFQVHGSPAVVRRLMRAAVSFGARPAEPGEFTRRAFLNGRMDLARAEAVADLIRAETDASARAAREQLGGALSERIESLRQIVITLAAEIEARIDFPDEGLEEADLARLGRAFATLQTELDSLWNSRGRGRLLREGARVALIGPPNVGKSSLLNALARADRAIVTPHAGTTRDTIECVVDLGGIAVTLVDTAGLRESVEPIEKLGVERSRRAMEEADLVIEVRDSTGQIPPLALEAMTRRPDLIVLNKADLKPSAGELDSGVAVSALKGNGLEALEERIALMLFGESHSSVGGEHLTVNTRQAGLLERARDAVAAAKAAWDQATGGELIMIDLRDALGALDEILGLAPGEAILDRVFEQFCIGK